MGPTNIALVKLFQADQQLREAQARLDSVTRNARIQERKSSLRVASDRLEDRGAASGRVSPGPRKWRLE